MESATRAAAKPAPPIGAMIRDWRAVRRLSQLDLALEAEISARHLSCIETGKAQPSRRMVEKLADVLEAPLRERNAMLIAAGFAPQYRESGLDAPELAPMRRAISLILRQQEPFPALVTDRYWDILAANGAFQRLGRLLTGGGPGQPNVMRQVFDPKSVRPFIANWAECAGDVIRHLHRDAAAAPLDERLQTLIAEAMAYPDVPQTWRRRDPTALPTPTMTTHLKKGDLDLRFFSTLTVFHASQDVTLDETRIECMFPADEATERLCRELLT